MSELISTNPAANYVEVGRVLISSEAEIHEKVAKAHEAKAAWRNLGVEGRIELLKPIRDEFQARSGEMAELITLETGKPIKQSLAEAEGYINDIDWFLENGPRALQDEVTHEDDKSVHRIAYEPIGVAASIAPWNFPFGMAVWGTFPNLVAGNTVVFKTSEECPLTGKLFEEIMTNHDLPEGVFSEVYGAGDVGKVLTESNIDLIWFTGSTRTGKSLYKTAADKFIKAVLEMGGSSPVVVFDDVDIAEAASIVFDGRFQNCGQVCAALKRLIVHESVADELAAELKKLIEGQIMGDPANQATQIGSLVAKRQLELAEEQLQDAMAQGAEIVAQTPRPEGLQGAFMQPVLLRGINPEMRVWREETFAPILPLVTFNDEAEAIQLANDTPYGLNARVMSGNVDRAERVGSQIDAGSIEINSGDRWLACNPFGGYKDSGLGRELGIHGLQELSQIKLVSKSK